MSSDWNIGWNTLADIALCALILRFLFGWWFANKRLGALILTLVAMGSLIFLIYKLRLPLASFVSIVAGLPVAFLLIISSIPDLRRAYHSASYQNLFSLRQTMSEDLVKVIATTVLELARMRRGALLVFPQQDDIEPFLTGGEEYDARVTRSLLLSIFNPGAPRHDGAVVIRRGKIIRVGAVLPIGSSDHAREEWGTRHLAALGLAEQCDARVVVVSEERGTISLAHDDEIDELPVADERSVTDLISSVMYAHDLGERQEVRFKHSMILWAFALVLAGIAAPVAARFDASANAVTPNSMVITSAPIVFSDVPEHLFLRSYSANACTVNLSMPAKDARMPPANLRVNVGLANLPPGSTSITLTQRMLVGIPNNWEINRYEPDKIDVSLAEAKKVRLPIEPTYIGLPEGFRVASFKCEPPDSEVIVKDDAPLKGRRLTTIRLTLANITEAGGYSYPGTPVEYPASVQPASGAKDTPVKVTLLIENTKRPGR